jgi:hypothetical protein
VIAGPLFVVAFLVEGATRPDDDPLRHPASSLALGPFGWTQTAKFIVAGLLTPEALNAFVVVGFGVAAWRRGERGRSVSSI